MKTKTKMIAGLLLCSGLTPVMAQDAAAPAAPAPRAARAQVETWMTEKPINAKPEWKGPNRPIWRLADLKKMHAGQNNWVQPIVLDNEQEATYVSAAPGSKVSPRIHPDTDTVFVVTSGQIRFTVEGQEPAVATRTSIVNIMKNTMYSYEVIGTENALFVEDNVRGYSTLYPVSGPVPAPAKGDEMVKVSFPRGPSPYTGINKLHFNTLDAIASCKVGAAVVDSRMYLTPHVTFVNPAEDKCAQAAAAAAAAGGGGGRGGRRGAGAAAGGEDDASGPATPLNYKGTFGHLHSGAVEWWVVQLGGISGTFEDQGEFHAVEGDILYAPPST